MDLIGDVSHGAHGCHIVHSHDVRTPHNADGDGGRGPPLSLLRAHAGRSGVSNSRGSVVPQLCLLLAQRQHARDEALPTAAHQERQVRGPQGTQRVKQLQLEEGTRHKCER